MSYMGTYAISTHTENIIPFIALLLLSYASVED